LSINQKDIPLDTRTVLLKSSIQDILKRTLGAGKTRTRKGIDFRLYTCGDGATSKEKQTVATFLTSMANPNPDDRADRNTVDKLLAESLDKILLSDRVRSCSDFYKTNNKDNLDSSKKMRVIEEVKNSSSSGDSSSR
jgi:hypothetical protein